MASGTLRFKNSAHVEGRVTLNDPAVPLVLSTGTTAERPLGAIFGMIRANSTTGRLEYFQGGAWREIMYRGDTVSDLTVTGTLLLGGAPTSDLQAATKKYVDDALAGFSSGSYLPLAGGTMTGALVLAGNPSTALQAATKQYVDSGDAALLTLVNGRLALTGGTMTGPIVLSGAPTLPLHATTKAYVDAAVAGVTPDLSSRVAKAGDTMTGALILSGDPTLALQAATKQYVDNGDAAVLLVANNAAAAAATKLPLSGGTLTGPLTLSGAPTSPLHAATKAYVDAAAQGLDVKTAAVAASNTNVSLSSPGATIGGVTLSIGDRVLLIGQTDPTENGIYVFGGASSPLVRSTDADTTGEITSGTYVFVTDGDLGGSGFIVTTSGTITIGTTPITFTQFSSAGQTNAGAGLTKTGNTIDVGAGDGIAVSADAVSLTGQALALHQLGTSGLIARIASGAVAGRAIIGTTNRIVVTSGNGVSGNPQIDIDSNYAGQTSINTVGTVTTGTWQGTAVGVAYGGTGATTAAGALSNLGAAGTDSPTFTGTVTLPAGTASDPGVVLQPGVPLTTPEIGAIEFDGTTVKITTDVGGVPVRKTVAFAENLGTMAYQNANNVNITGGSITTLTTFDSNTVDGGSF